MTEVSKIKEDFNKVITYSQGIAEPKTDKLFDIWFKAKQDLIEVFGNKFIYEYPEKVCFNLDDKYKASKITSFIHDLQYVWGNGYLADFVEDQADGFFNNITVSDYTAPNGEVIKKGSKLVKAFKYFIENKRVLADIQNEASRIIQENKIEGTLCFSVHPLDFLSVSENTYNWRSCHALDGEYRAGNLSYMMDSCTFICYLKSDKMEKLPHFPEDVPWNSKKWRVMMYISNDWKMMIAGRQYPFESTPGIDKVLEVLKRRIFVEDGSVYWSDWNNNIITEMSNMTNGLNYELDIPYIPINTTILPLDIVFRTKEGSKFFNDVLDSTCYKPIYSIKYLRYPWLSNGGYATTTEERTRFDVGGYTYCLYCGEKECLEKGNESMLCEECELKYGNTESELFTRCDCCGIRMHTEEAFCVEDSLVCRECFKTETVECEFCGERVWRDNIIYKERINKYICKYCFDEYDGEDE